MTVRTGATEPTWPEKEGAKVIEYSVVGASAAAPAEDTDTPPRLPPEVEDRYDLKFIGGING